ncbi:MAG: pyridoxamine 5'-phosphate oxidase family protein [Lachnospiraceae bacterium]|nr:pyridoxamine 5'-phosphate oxidase family protein [Robinsoniella sp.]MDY3765418.1 pyridoxamine 5'-phosphate oxidase family protein [Lachnospiraceae bacterium]
MVNKDNGQEKGTVYRTMRLKKREVTQREELRQILEECKVVRIGTSDEEGMLIVPLNYGYEWKTDAEGKEKLQIYFHSARDGRKVEAFAKNPKVAFELDCAGSVIRGDYACAYSFAYRSIMGNGTVRLLEKREEKQKALDQIMCHMAPDAKVKFEDAMIERVNVYCLEAEHFTGKMRQDERERKNDTGSTN